ncbi:hypothetical protein FRC11_003619, partial [Ceratobasidium sp. 423]
MYNLGLDAGKAIARLLKSHGIMLSISASCALRLDGLTSIAITSALEGDILPFTGLHRFDMFDENKSSLNINFSL